MQRVYLYSDESGHKGQEAGLFVVAGVAISAHANVIRQKLLRIEQVSKKGKTKWNKTKNVKTRRRYVEAVFQVEQLKGCAFCHVHDNLLIRSMRPWKLSGGRSNDLEAVGSGQSWCTKASITSHENRYVRS